MATLLNALHDVILAREVQVWDALVRGDASADAGLLADDFVGVYADGFADKADHVGQLLKGATVTTFAIVQSRLIQLGPDHCILTYQADFQRQGSSEGEAMMVSSVWAQRDGAWMNIFSQDTAMVET